LFIPPHSQKEKHEIMNVPFIFTPTPLFWLNLQKNYELWQAEHISKEWQLIKPFPQQLLHANG